MGIPSESGRRLGGHVLITAMGGPARAALTLCTTLFFSGRCYTADRLPNNLRVVSMAASSGLGLRVILAMTLAPIQS